MNTTTQTARPVGVRPAIFVAIATVLAALLVTSQAFAQSLAWDLPSGPAPTGFAVIIDGVRTDKGLTPLGANGSCGCTTPLGLSGGNHTIVIGAYNANGESDSAPLVIGPTANAGGPYSGVTGTPLSVDGSKSNAPTGSLTTYSWKWGDGATTTGAAATASHTYANTGVYTITLTVTDNAGATASATTTATIASPVSTPPSSGVPAPWATQDVGAVGLTGSATYTAPTFTVTGAGADIWGTADAFRFVYQPLTGDGDLVARVTGELNTDPYAKAGIMLRESLTSGAADVILDIRPDGSIEFMARSTTGGATTYLGGTTHAFPAWLKLSRTGGSVSALVSSDGSTWSTIGSTAIGLPTTADAGLAVTSHTTAALNTGTFDSVAVTPQTSQTPQGLSSQDIGAVGLAGTTSLSNGTYTVAGAGADIWGTADAFRYVSGTLNGDGQIVARVTGITNTNTYAKAGVMLRETLAPDSKHVILDERPDGSIEFMVRTATGGSTTFVAGSAETTPVWLELQRTGTTITASISPDGTTWSQVGTTTVSLATSLYAGLAVTSHDTTLLNTSTFDNVTIAASSASAPPPTSTSSDVVVYANDVPSTGIHGAWSKVSDSTAAAGIVLATPDKGAAAVTSPLASPTDYVDVSFNAAANTPYTVWFRLRATANSKYNDSLWAQFSDARSAGASLYAIGSTSGLLVNLATDSTGASIQGWGWQNKAYWLTQTTTVTFPVSGTHTLRVQVREDGIQFDQIVLSPQKYLSVPPGPVSNDNTIVPKP